MEHVGENAIGYDFYAGFIEKVANYLVHFLAQQLRQALDNGFAANRRGSSMMIFWPDSQGSTKIPSDSKVLLSASGGAFTKEPGVGLN